MTTSNILSLPFRKSTQISLSNSIQQYISKKYDQHSDMFRHDLDAIDTLRRDAVNVHEAHPSGIKKLQTYAGQLVWIGGKFPIDIGADFTWYPSLGYHTEHPLVQNNLKYELMNVLYNLAALYSQLAIASNRGNTDGLKTAATCFSQAAGVLTHMKTEILPELRMDNPPDDMDDTTLESLIQLFLAQSQECFWQKAVMDGYKDASIAKLAARVSDLYNLAGEAAMRSEAISSAWIHHTSAKHHHFAAAAQYRAACDCLEKRKYGEEVARLRDAGACVNEGLRECKGGYLNKAVIDDLNGLKKRVEEDLKRAEKDNDLIYLQAVPPKSELKILDRANMAVARIPPEVAKPYDHFGDHAAFGPALFTRLVPFAVQVAVSIYDERRDRLVNNNIISELESMTDKLHQILSSLNLPGSLQALEKPLGLPGTLVQHADEIRQADALNRLQRGFGDIEKLCASDRAVFEEAKALLAAEEEEDMNLRLEFGKQRWTRPESRADPSHDGGAKLWNQVAETEGYFASSTSSDAVVREKYASVQDTLALLAGPDRNMLDFIPNSRRVEIPESLKPTIGRLRGAYNEVLRMESRRRKRVEGLMARSRADDIKPDILAETARLQRTYPSTPIVTAHFEDFFEKRLDSLYEADIDGLEKEGADQEKLLADLQRANQEFEAQKRSVGDKGNHDREKALQKLDNAYYKYKEIVSNVEVGRKFYNDLSRIVEQFRNQARQWVNQRRQEARGLENELSMPPLSSLSISQPRASPQPYQSPGSASYYTSPPQPQHLRQVVHSPPAEAHIQSWADNVPQQQPKPMAPMQGAWIPDMGIKFAPSPVAGGNPQGGQQGGNVPMKKTWDPNSGIRFG
ncbi:BRO1-like domain-containing protein [Lasiosphaeria miniovina]|uniref:BRO1-like domain-containing protein n=1 Tax=Lasiosphaeria miniovina TaxID=1954250 RepID=A0AA40DUR4_9PEZI|nr:BRO1-like domain-containing protein [Lasiosphaeria miniovina]KAK0712548.1 BRO1-like domain-containing protein [Lasiosphaeria miniovina]